MGMNLLAAVTGFAFGALAACGNMAIARRSMKSTSPASVLISSLLRFIVNAGALAVVYFLRNSIPLPFYGTIIGTALGLSVCGVALSVRLSRSLRAEDNKQTTSTEETD